MWEESLHIYYHNIYQNFKILKKYFSDQNLTLSLTLKILHLALSESHLHNAMQIIFPKGWDLQKNHKIMLLQRFLTISKPETRIKTHEATYLRGCIAEILHLRPLGSPMARRERRLVPTRGLERVAIRWVHRAARLKHLQHSFKSASLTHQKDLFRVDDFVENVATYIFRH